MTEVFKQIIALLIAEDILFDITKKDNRWYIYHDDLWDIEDKIFAFPQLATYYTLGYWDDSQAKSYIVQIKSVEEKDWV